MYEKNIHMIGVAAQQDKGTNDDGYDVPFEVALDRTGYGRCQWCVTLLGGLVITCSYIGVGAVSLILPPAQCDLQMTSYNKGTLISAGFVGIILSCHMWGFLSDTMGRRYIMIRCVLMDGLFYILTSFMPYYPLFLGLRFVHGFASCGLVVPVYAYVGEFHTDKHRTKAIMIASLLACFAYLYLSVSAWVTISASWELRIFSWLTYKPWRLYYALLGVPSLICTLCMLTMPESPKYLLAADRKEEALEVLKRVHKINGSKAPGPFDVRSILLVSKEGIAKLENNSNKVLAFLNVMWRQTVPLFRPPHRFGIALICLIQYLLYFCNNGIFLWLPETANRLGKFITANEGKSASLCYILQNYEKNNPTNSTANGTEQHVTECISTVNPIVYICMISMAFAIFFSLLMLCVLTKIVPKKIVLGGFIFIALAAAIAMVVTEGTYILIVEMGAMIMLTGSSSPIITAAVVDLFPTKIRAMAVCLTILSARLGTITANQVAGILIDHHCFVILWMVVGSLVVCVLINIILPTKPGYLEDAEKENQRNEDRN